jgi:uncharacterized membrane protein YeaQ/YmgE (transglycosylase-associated protein family)
VLLCHASSLPHTSAPAKPGSLSGLILPGKQGGGWIATLILGLIGAMVGGWLAGLFGVSDAYTNFWSIAAWLWSIGGAIVVLLIWGFITRGRAKA